MPLGLLMRVYQIDDGLTKYESLISFMAGREQITKSLLTTNGIFPGTSERRIEILAPFAINVQLRIGNLLFYHLTKYSVSPNIKANFKDKFLTTMLK